MSAYSLRRLIGELLDPLGVVRLEPRINPEQSLGNRPSNNGAVAGALFWFTEGNDSVPYHPRMESAIPLGRMIPGRFYRITYRRGEQPTAVEGRYEGRELAASGEQLVLTLPQTGRLYVHLTAVSLVEPVELLPEKWIK